MLNLFLLLPCYTEVVVDVTGPPNLVGFAEYTRRARKLPRQHSLLEQSISSAQGVSHATLWLNWTDL